MSFTFEQYWKKPYNLAIIWCTHWDETLWLEVIKWLKEQTIEDVTYILANKKAQEANVRFIEDDLNRCFVDDNPEKEVWSYENKLSYELDLFLKQFNYIIDLHSTFFNVPWYFIIDNINKVNLPILSWTSVINKVYLLEWLKWALISKYDNAVAIEIWHNNDLFSINKVIQTILEIIDNFNTWITFDKEIFKWSWEILKKDISKLKKWLDDFSFIRKWEIIWFNNDWIPVLANEDTCLLWVNLEDNNILCHKLKRQNNG